MENRNTPDPKLRQEISPQGHTFEIGHLNSLSLN